MSNKISKTILDHIGDGILTVDSTLHVIFANNVACKILRVNFDDITGKHVDEVISLSKDYDKQNVIYPFVTALATGEPANYVQPMLLNSISDEEVYISDSVSPIRNSSSDVIGAVMTFRDVSEEVKILQQLQIANDRYKTLFDSIKSGVAVYESNDGVNFYFVDFNPAAELIDGVNKSDIIGQNVDNVFPGIKELGLLEAIKRVWKTGNCERIPCALYSDSIRTEWRDNYIYKLASNEVVVVYEDVTHKKNQANRISDSVEKLRNNERRLRNMFDNSGVGMVAISSGPEFQIKQVNKSFCKFIGYSKNELVGMSIIDITNPDDIELSLYNDNLSNNLPSSAGAIQFSKRYISKSGAIKWGSVFLTKIEHDDGVIEHFSQVIDITAQKRAEIERELLIEIVAQLNSSDVKNKNKIGKIMQSIKKMLNIDAVAVRLPERLESENINDYTFYYHDGFDQEFINDEKSLYCTCDTNEHILECVCGCVISGTTDKRLPFFTEHGSFWTNSIASVKKAIDDFNYIIPRPRTACWNRKYESIAIIPIIAGDVTVGAILLNAYRCGVFDKERVEFLEKVGKAMGVAFSRMQLRSDIEDNRKALAKANDILEIESNLARTIADESDATLDSILDLAIKKLNVQSLGTFIIGESDVTGKWTNGKGASTDSFVENIKLGSSEISNIKKWILEQNIYEGSVDNMPECFKNLAKQVDRKLMIIPVLNRKYNQPVGSVMISYKTEYCWSEAEKEAMRGFATLLCIIAKSEKNRIEIKRKIEETILTISNHVPLNTTEVQC